MYSFGKQREQIWVEGHFKGRCISENIRLLDSVIKYTEGKNIPGLLLFIDFEKAFDILEWPCISKNFGFGPSLLNWIELFYCYIESCILHGQVIFLNSVEELGKAALCRHIFLF